MRYKMAVSMRKYTATPTQTHETCSASDRCIRVVYLKCVVIAVRSFNRLENETRTEQQKSTCRVQKLQLHYYTMSIHFSRVDDDDREAMVDVSVEGTPGREIPER